MSDKTTRILLIDGNPGDARFIRKVLADTMPADPSAPAFDLTCARRLSTGLKRLAKDQFDVVLLDLSLPDSFGLDTFVKTHAQASELPIIVLSDPGNKEMALEAVQKGAQDYLLKGEVSGNLLVRAIRYAIEHKRAKEVLRESEERSRNLSELISDFAYTARVEPNGSFVVEWTTAAFTRITGFTTEEWAHGGWQTLFHPEDLPAVIRFGERLLSGESNASDFRIITKSGKVHWIQNYSRPVWDERQARVVRIIGAFHDITKRKQTEAQLERNLRETRVRYEVSQALASAETEDEVLDALIQQAGLYPQAHVAILTFDRTKSELTIILRRDKSFESGMPIVVPRGTPFPVSRFPVLNLLPVDQPFVSDAAFTDERVDLASRELLRQAEATSYAVFPLTIGSEQLGYVIALAKSAGYFDEEKQHLYQTLAEQGAVALRAARLWETIRESQQQLSLLVQQSPMAVIELNTDLQVVSWNPAAERIFGYTHDEVRGRSVASLIVPEAEQPIADQKYTNLLVQQGSTHAIHNNLTKDGRPITCEWFNSPLVNAEGKTIGVASLAQDITERKQAEEALAQERNLLRTLIDNLPDAVYVKDIAGRKTLANRADLRNMQVESEADALDKTDFDVFPEELATQFYANDQVVLQTGQAILDHEEMIGEFDGQQRWILTSKLPLRDTTGRIIGLVGIGHDITERRQAQQALRESEERFRTLVETSSDWIWEVDEHDVYTYASPKVKDLLGYEPAEIVGRTPFDLMLPEEAERVRAQMVEISQARRAFAGLENTNQHKDGRLVVLETSGVPIFDVNGVFRGYRGIDRDITERERVKEALLRINKAVESSSDAIGISDAQAHHFYHNKAFTELFEYTPEELEAAGGGPAAYADKYVAHEVFDTIVSGGAWSGEVEMVSKSGRKFPVLLRADAIKDESGKVIGLVGVHTDITERKRAEEALTQERNLLRLLIDNLPEAISLKDLAGRIILSNPIDQRYLGVATEDEVLGKTDLDMYPEEAATEYSAADELVIRTDRPLLNEEALFIDANGREYHTLFSKLPLRNAAGQVVGVLTVLRDITERKRAEEERERLLAQVQEQAQRVQQIMNTVPEGVLLLDADDRVVLANPLGKQDLATLAQAQVGDVITHLGDRPLAELLTLPPQGLWHEVTTDGSSPRIFEIVARPIEAGPAPDRASPELAVTEIEEPAEGWVLVIRDVTQERETEQRVWQQEQLAAVGQLAGGIAHDFNNLLTTIVLYTQIGLGKPDLSPDLTRALETILGASRQAAELVQQILDFSRRSPIETHPVNLTPFVQEAVHILQRTIPESISLLLEIEPGEHVVNADPTRIQQVLMNLVLNARDAMPEGGKLRIALSRVEVRADQEPPLAEMASGEWICLAVADTGSGIPPEVLPHIFEPFFTTKPPGKGTGLGLAQVYGIVTQHGGHIGMETQVGQGTAFRVYLPARPVEGEERLQEEAALAVPEGKGETILLVEDNEWILEVGQEILESLGYRVLTAANGREALEVYRSAGTIDLMITDVVMPEMGGKELMRELRSIDPDLKAVGVTGHVLAEDLEELKKEGILAIVYKPFDVSVLAQVIRQVLDPDRATAPLVGDER